MLARGYVDHFLAEVGRTQEGHYTDQQLIVTLKVLKAVEVFDSEIADAFNSMENIADGFFKHCFIIASRYVEDEKRAKLLTQILNFCVNKVLGVALIEL